MKHFSPFRADLRAGRLWRDGSSVHLSGRAFSVLRHFLERPGQLVSKEELITSVWPDTPVEPDNVKVLISEIRAALGDNVGQPRFILTIPRRGYRLIAPVVEVPSDLPVASQPMLVGRDAEIGVLRDALARAAGGARQTLFLKGPAGIGKSYLVENFLGTALTESARVTWATCMAPDSQPLGPLVRVLVRLMRGDDSQRIAGVISHYAPAVRALVGSLSKPAAPVSSQPVSPGRLLREITAAIEVVAADLPLIIWLDDLHAAHAATLEAIIMLGLRPDPARLLVIGTMLPLEGSVSASETRRILGTLVSRAQATVRTLEPLDEPAVREYVRLRVGDASLDELGRILQRATEGNPSLVASTFDRFINEGHLDIRDGRWRLTTSIEHLKGAIEASLVEALDHQIAMLPADDRRVIEQASVVGRKGPLWLLAQALASDEIELESQLRRIQRRVPMVLTLAPIAGHDDGAESTFRFRHALHHERVLMGMAPGERAAAHGRLADALSRVAGDRQEDLAPDMARHFLEAGEVARAVHALRLAARAAAARCAPREAAALLDAAESHARGLGRDDSLDLGIEAGLAVADAHVAAGDHERAVAVLRRTEHLTQRLGNHEMRLRTHLRLARTHAYAQCEEARWWAREARLLANSHTSPIAAATVIEAAVLELLCGGWSDDLADAAAAAARRLSPDTMHQHRSAGIAVQCVNLLRSRYAIVIASGRRLLAAARRAGDSSTSIVCCGVLALAALHEGRPVDAAAHASEGRALAEREERPADAAILEMVEAWIAVETQQWDEALGMSNAVRARSGAVQPLVLQMSLLFGGIASLHTGRVADAERDLVALENWLARERVVLDWCWRVHLKLAMAELALTSGDTARARSESARATVAATALPERTWRSCAYTMTARAALAAGDRDAASRALRSAVREIAAVPAPLARWRLEAFRAELFTHLGRQAEAQRARQREIRIRSMLQHDGMPPGRGLPRTYGNPT